MKVPEQSSRHQLTPPKPVSTLKLQVLVVVFLLLPAFMAAVIGGFGACVLATPISKIQMIGSYSSTRYDELVFTAATLAMLAFWGVWQAHFSVELLRNRPASPIPLVKVGVCMTLADALYGLWVVELGVDLGGMVLTWGKPDELGLLYFPLGLAIATGLSVVGVFLSRAWRSATIPLEQSRVRD